MLLPKVACGHRRAQAAPRSYDKLYTSSSIRIRRMIYFLIYLTKKIYGLPHSHPATPQRPTHPKCTGFAANAVPKNLIRIQKNPSAARYDDQHDAINKTTMGPGQGAASIMRTGTRPAVLGWVIGRAARPAADRHRIGRPECPSEVDRIARAPNAQARGLPGIVPGQGLAEPPRRRFPGSIRSSAGAGCGHAPSRNGRGHDGRGGPRHPPRIRRP